jgi:hypothetical protein
MNATQQMVIRKLTPEEQREALEALDRVARHATQLLSYRQGQTVPTSAELLHEAREQRERELS